MTIHGWDASHYDVDPARGPMDMVAAKAAGVRFYVHKVTEGTSFVDGTSPTMLARARNAAIPLIGGYHVLHSNNINAQVDWYVSHLPAWWDQGPWLTQLDCERWENDFPPPSAVKAWCDRFHQLYPRYTPIVYASKGQYGDRLLGLGYPLWNANYPTGIGRPLAAAYGAAGGDTGVGWSAYSGQTPVIDQFTSNATIGSQKRCDANAYRGTIDELKALVTTGGESDLTPEEHGMLADIHFTLTSINDPADPAGKRVPLHVALPHLVTAILSHPNNGPGSSLSEEDVKAAVKAALTEGTGQ